MPVDPYINPYYVDHRVFESIRDYMEDWVGMVEVKITLSRRADPSDLRSSLREATDRAATQLTRIIQDYNKKHPGPPPGPLQSDE